MTHVPLVGPVLAALRQTDAALWQRTVRAALARHQSVPAAAAALGVTRRTLDRWIAAEPALARGVELPGRGRRARDE